MTQVVHADASWLPTADALFEQYPLTPYLRENVRKGLEPLLQAYAEDTNLNANGRARNLANIHDDLRRLQAISDDRERYPEIRNVEIKRPMFILGLPRCGTSFLHAIIDGDPNVRTPLMWEVAHPSPPPEAATFDTDPRIAEFDAYIEREFGGEINELLKAHPIGAKIPQECGSMMTTSFHSSNPCMMSHIPGYYSWFLGADLTFRYEVHKMWLQQLSWKNPRKYWVLKIQEHMYAIPELLKVYPDAVFVQPHRDPTTVIASISQLIYVIRSVAYDQQDKHALGQEFLHLWHDGLARIMAYRKEHPDLPIYDMRYKELVADPVKAVGGIYENFGMEYTEAARQGIRHWLAENPAGKHGKHAYTLEDFGLTVDEIRDVYADYIETYRDYI
ncbi:MAG: sulfotransferase family protein [Porticoccaceae bacterium]|nr:sulfotransferase family protein [Porticoccaceae bacterium]